MIRISRILFGAIFLFIAACDKPLLNRLLPFPTPAQHDLIVLVAAGPLTWFTEDSGTTGGIEHDLIDVFAQELGVGVKYVHTRPDEINERMANGEAHIAIGWLGEPEDPQQRSTPPILQSHDLLVQHEASLPISRVEELRDRTIHALSGSRQLANLRKLQKNVPGLKVVVSDKANIFDLLEGISDQRIELAAIDSTLGDLATQLNPSLQMTLRLGEDAPIVWWLGHRPNSELSAQINRFAEKVQRDGTLARIEDRYFGHVRRLKQADIISFLGEIESTLPKLRRYFQAAQMVTGIDWRLIAAVAYHESKWDPSATSYTNVRGIMMLTEETADRLKVQNRLDPKEAILAGARYINLLKDQLGPETPEPDRTWLALAAYNIGPGNFGAAQRLAKLLNADPSDWYEMKSVLPKLAQPKVQQQLKTGRIRGGEAVVLVENIRSYYTILLRNTQPLTPTPAIERNLRRLVAEVEQLQKNHVSKAKAMPVMVSMTGDNDSLRLPLIESEAPLSSSGE